VINAAAHAASSVCVLPWQQSGRVRLCASRDPPVAALARPHRPLCHGLTAVKRCAFAIKAAVHAVG